MSDNNQIFQVPAFITEIKGNSKSSLKFKVETMENLSGDAMHRFFSMIDKPGFFCFAVRQIESDDILDLPMPEMEKKSKSQLLRAVLWSLWNQNDMKYTEFDDYYEFMMNHIINKMKGKLS